MPNRTVLSEIDGERVIICCKKCGFVSNLSINVLIGSYGDMPLAELSSSLSDRCIGFSGEKLGSECEFVIRNTAKHSSIYTPTIADLTVASSNSTAPAS
jgi:hypothetical protein